MISSSSLGPYTTETTSAKLFLSSPPPLNSAVLFWLLFTSEMVTRFWLTADRVLALYLVPA